MAEVAEMGVEKRVVLKKRSLGTRMSSQAPAYSLLRSAQAAAESTADAGKVGSMSSANGSSGSRSRAVVLSAAVRDVRSDSEGSASPSRMSPSGNCTLRKVNFRSAPRASLHAIAAAAAAASTAAPRTTQRRRPDSQDSLRRVNLAPARHVRPSASSSARVSRVADREDSPSDDEINGMASSSRQVILTSKAASGKSASSRSRGLDAPTSDGSQRKRKQVVLTSKAGSQRRSSNGTSRTVEKRKSELKEILHTRRGRANGEASGEDEDSVEAVDDPQPRKRRRRRHVGSCGAARPRPQVHTSSTVDSGELTEAEKDKLRAAINAHLCKICGADDAQVVTDFVGVMVEERKSSKEMTDELTFFKEGAAEFVDWVHRQIAKLIARRPPMASVSNDIRHASSRSAVGSRAPPRRSGSTRATSDAEADGHSAIDLSDVEDRLPSGTSSRHRRSRRTLAEDDDVVQRKKNLLAGGTSMLQDILAKLSTPGISEQERERWSQMADKMKANMDTIGGRG